MSSKLVGTLAVLVALQSLAAVPSAAAQCEGTEHARYTPLDAGANDRFGVSVALDAEVMVVGAPEEDNEFENGGAAYVYRLDGLDWVETARVTSSQPGFYEEFARAVALDGDVAVMSTRLVEGEPPLSGAAHVFRFDGDAWVEEAILTASDAAQGDTFGWSLAISGDTIVVGALWADSTDVPGSGAVYVFEFDGMSWSETAKLVTAPQHGGQFGFSVATNGDRIAVGARWHGALDGGAAHVFRRDGTAWVDEASMAGVDSEPNEHFGSSVGIDGDLLVVGAPGHDPPEGDPNAGGAYVYRRNGANWASEGVLTSAAGGLNDELGTSVSIDGNRVLVGAPRYDGVWSQDAGGAVLFHRLGAAWAESAIIRATFDASLDEFGSAVALDGEWGLIGAPRDKTGVMRTGAVYVVKNLYDCDGSGTIDFCDLIDGRSHDCDGDQVVDACQIADDPALDLDASGVLDSCELAGDLDGDGAVTESDVCQWHVRPIDVNSDGIIDATDLKLTITLAGSFPDCNHNLIPDQCEGVQLAERLPMDDPGGFAAPTAITAGYLLVGAPSSSVAGPGAGAARLHRRVGDVWRDAGWIVPDPPVPDNQFGTAVAVDGDLAAVGVPFDDTLGASAGAVYLFRLDAGQWTQEAILHADDGSAGDRFGERIDVRGKRVLVGARGHDLRANNAGAAYVFRLVGATWTQEEILFSPDADASDRFGRSVALGHQTVLVGANLDDGGGENAGAAYVFVRSGNEWILQAALRAAEGAPADRFGQSVAIDGDVAVVGAIGVSEVASEAGAAYVFRRMGVIWREACTLLPPGGEADDHFGAAVAVAGGAVSVGAPGTDLGPIEDAGAVFNFRYDELGCFPEKIIVDDDPAANVGLGGSVDMYAAGLAMSAAGGAAPGVLQYSVLGSADRDGNGIPDECDEDCNGNGVPDVIDLADGTSIDCNVNGIPDECDIAYESSADCNRNGIPDECDINYRIDADVAYDFEDISATGDEIMLGGDEISGGVDLGFVFEFYHVERTEIRVGSNGFLTFLAGQDPGCCWGQPIPLPDSPNALIAGWWADLNLNTGGAIHVQTLGTAPQRRFIAQYTDIQHWFSDQAVTFQIKLFEQTNRIEFHYELATTNGAPHTIGVEDDDGLAGRQIYWAPYALPTPLAVGLHPPGSRDAGGNDVPDDCDCPGDESGDGVVDARDLLIVLDEDGIGDRHRAEQVERVLGVLSNWGDCPGAGWLRPIGAPSR